MFQKYWLFLSRPCLYACFISILIYLWFFTVICSEKCFVFRHSTSYSETQKGGGNYLSLCVYERKKVILTLLGCIINFLQPTARWQKAITQLFFCVTDGQAMLRDFCKNQRIVLESSHYDQR